MIRATEQHALIPGPTSFSFCCQLSPSKVRWYSNSKDSAETQGPMNITFLQRLGLCRFNQVKMTAYYITETFNLITNVPPSRNIEIHTQAENSNGVEAEIRAFTIPAQWEPLKLAGQSWELERNKRGLLPRAFSSSQALRFHTSNLPNCDRVNLYSIGPDREKVR